MLKGLGDLGNIMKLQRDFKNVQKKLKKAEAEGESSDGTVKIRVNGEYRIVDIKIEQGLIDSGDKVKIEKSILLASNIAMDRIKDYAAEEMGKLTGGMNIPGLTDFLK
jgi:nucleoid-associated protein EbfC